MKYPCRSVAEAKGRICSALATLWLAISAALLTRLMTDMTARWATMASMLLGCWRRSRGILPCSRWARSKSAGMMRTAEAERCENWELAWASVIRSGRTAWEFPSAASRLAERGELAWSTTTRRTRLSVLPPVPPARTSVKTIGRMRKKSHSDQPVKRIRVSFQAIAKIFFIRNSFLVDLVTPGKAEDVGMLGGLRPPNIPNLLPHSGDSQIGPIFPSTHAG